MNLVCNWHYSQVRRIDAFIMLTIAFYIHYVNNSAFTSHAQKEFDIPSLGLEEDGTVVDRRKTLFVAPQTKHSLARVLQCSVICHGIFVTLYEEFKKYKLNNNGVLTFKALGLTGNQAQRTIFANLEKRATHVML